nr:UPF0047 protein YjbQ-like [Ipomoea batatas]
MATAPRWAQKTITLPPQTRGCHLVTSKGVSAPWKHTLEGPDDMPAHIKSSMFGCTLMIPITDGKLNMGTWQRRQLPVRSSFVADVYVEEGPLPPLMLATHVVRGRGDRHYLQQIISQFQNLLLKHLKWDPCKPGVTSNLSGYKFRQFEHKNLMKSKPTAVKMYANLKKMKQNISPGARLTNFLNSLFANGKPKPAAIKPSPEDPKRPLQQPSTLAVVSRSCLNKTPRSTMG